MTTATTILEENKKRYKKMHAYFNPITGQGSILARKKIVISDFPIPEQWLPVDMLNVLLIKQIIQAGSIGKFLTDFLGTEDNEENSHEVVKSIVRLRIRYDFCFWAALLVYIHPKGGGDDVHFILNYPQRKLITYYEERR